MTVQRVPDGDHAETDQSERHGPFHGTTIVGLARPDDLAGVGEGLLNSPTRPVAGDLSGSKSWPRCLSCGFKLRLRTG
jgi:hypothetical protein